MARLDQLLVVRGLVPSRTRAAALISDGHVSVAGRVVTKPATKVATDAQITVGDADHYVSRAAHKLIGALDQLDLHPYGTVLDAGASTGGFTQVLLERGVDHVHAMDVGHDQLHQTIRKDPRVTAREGINLRGLTLADVGSPVDWIVADLSFISLTLVLQPLLSVLAPTGQALLMVKPQFEVGRSKLGSGGIVRNPDDREAAITSVIAAAAALGWPCHGRATSPLPGEHGNTEEFVWLTRSGRSTRAPILIP